MTRQRQRHWSRIVGRKANVGQQVRVIGNGAHAIIERLKQSESGALFATCSTSSGETFEEWTGRLLFVR